jgi:hypothetical protein
MGGSGIGSSNIARGRAAALRFGMLVEAGYKSDGFVAGERLHAGPILRVGMTLRP